MILGMNIQYEDYCTEHASWVLEMAGLIGREIDVIMGKPSDGLFSSYYNNMPVRYLPGQKYTVKWSEQEQCYYRCASSDIESFRVIGSIDLDVEKAVKRAYDDESGFDRLKELDPIYLTKIDDELIVVDTDYARKNEDECYLVLQYRWDYDNKYIENVLNEVLKEKDKIDFYFTYTYQDESDYPDGVICYHGCTVIEEYHTTCQCDGCTACDKSHEGKETEKIDTRKCSRWAAYGKAGYNAEQEYNFKQQLCKDCQLAELTAIDDIVLGYLDSMIETAYTDSEKWFYSDVIVALRTQYSFFYYDKLYDRKTAYDVTNDTPLHKVVHLIRGEHEHYDINVDKNLFYQAFGDERFHEGYGKEDEYFAVPTKLPVKEPDATQLSLPDMPE